MSGNNFKQHEALAEHRILDPGNGGTIQVVYSGVCALTTGATLETRVLPTPRFAGQRLVIVHLTDGGGDAAITVTNGELGQSANRTLTTGDAGDFCDMVGVLNASNALQWKLLTSTTDGGYALS